MKLLTNRKLLMFEKYSSEELCDVERDVHECFDEDMNLLIKDLPPADEHGFRPGSFVVTVEWEPEDE
jgi:hypothetical protein